MDIRVSVVALALILILAAGVFALDEGTATSGTSSPSGASTASSAPSGASAATCTTHSISPQEYWDFLSAIYSTKGVVTLQNIGSPDRQPVSTVNRDKVSLALPEQGVYRVEDVGKFGIDWEHAQDFFLKHYTFNGPWYIVAEIDDTLRVGIDAPGVSYTYGSQLRERFSGRAEYSGITGMFKSISGLLQQTVPKLNRFTPPIKNVIRGHTFTVTATCASDSCDRFMYSLLEKYVNVGQSLQMVAEFWGGALLKNVDIVPSKLKGRISGAVEKIRIKKPAASLEELADHLAGKTPSTVKESVFSKLSESTLSADVVSELSLADKEAIVADYPAIRETLDDLLGKVGEISASTRSTSPSTTSNVQGTIEILKKDLDLLEKFGIPVPKEIQIKKEITGNGKVKAQLLNLFDALQSSDETTRKLAVEQLEKILQTERRNLDIVYTAAAKDVGIGTSAWAKAKAAGLTGKVPSATKNPAGEAAHAAIFYVVKRISMPAASNPFAENGTYSAALVSSVLSSVGYSGTYKIPASWKYVQFYPPGKENPLYTDAFVDILAGHGSDPGDAFKSVMGVTIPVVSSLLSHTGAGSSIVKVLSVNDREMQMGPAIVAAGVPSQGCVSCSISAGKDNTLLMSGGTDVPLLGVVTEDSSPENGSLAILFGHHVDIAGPNVSLRLEDATTKENACSQKCPYAKLFGSEHAKTVAFLASTAQSLGFALGAGAGFIATAASMLYFEGCSSCVDYDGGYYVHVFMPPVTASEGSSSGGSALGQSQQVASTDLSGVLKTIAAASGKISKDLEDKINEFAQRIAAQSVENSGVFVRLDVKSLSTATLAPTKLMKLYAKPSTGSPTDLDTEGSLQGKSQTGDTVTFDRQSGTMSVDGKTIVQEPNLVRMAYQDYSIPGIVIPSFYVETAFSANPAMVIKPTAYSILDSGFLSCLASQIEGLQPSSQAFAKLFGKVVSLTTDSASVSFPNGRIVAVVNGVAYPCTEIDVGPAPDYRVTCKAVDLAPTEQDGKVTGTLKEKSVDMGSLVSVVLDNGALYRQGSAIYVVVYRLASAPGQYVKSVALSPNESGDGIIVKFTASPDAPEDVKKSIDTINKLVEQMGGVQSFLAQNGVVAIVRGPDGQLYLRTYDKNAIIKNVQDAMNLILGFLSGQLSYTQIYTADGGFVLRREANGSVILQYRTDTGVTTTVVTGYRVNGQQIELQTKDGKHTISFSQLSSGGVVVLVDGKPEGILVDPTAGFKQERIESIEQNPNNPNGIIVKTDQGTHEISIKLDANGTPYLTLDGKNLGTVSAMQGPRGMVAYNPDTGEWSFIAGLLTPLADAFKNGIKITVNGAGIAQATPSNYWLSRNPYVQQQSSGGFTLPLLEPQDLVFLLAALAIMYYSYARSQRG